MTTMASTPVPAHTLQEETKQTADVVGRWHDLCRHLSNSGHSATVAGWLLEDLSTMRSIFKPEAYEFQRALATYTDTLPDVQPLRSHVLAQPGFRELTTQVLDLIDLEHHRGDGKLAETVRELRNELKPRGQNGHGGLLK